MAPATINILLSSFPGLSLPPTLSIPLPSTSTVSDVTARINGFLPPSLAVGSSSLVVTTTNNKQLLPSSSQQLTTFLADSANTISDNAFVPLRLSARLLGGKGGFGSQLRAAGGRMSSRKKGAQGENNGSNRNLDGRRLRTVKEAKALAEYLALKPEMDKKEKEARRKRWELVVEAAEKREAEIRNGEGKGKVDGTWMEDKEEAGERAREAVMRAMKEGIWQDNLAGDALVGGSGTSASEGSGSAESGSPSEDSEMEDVEDADDPSEGSSSAVSKPAPARRFFGFDDDDDEFLSDEESEQEVEDATDVKGKGKAKA